MKLQSFLIAAALTISCGVKAQTMLPYNNPLLSAEERAKDLCSRLTLEEKTKLMMDRSQEIKRLGISRFEWWNEALHGVGRNGTATVFPITMCMASSWNDALLLDVFTSVSDELRAKNTIARKNNTLARYRGNSVWTPNINIFRDPRWGRGQETYGEDPYLTARMGLAVVRGLQGPEGSKYYKNLACAKHFAIHSGPEWNRHYFNVENIPARDLWETYLPAFKTLVEEGNVREVMCAYQRWDGDPCCGSNKLLRQILRDEWKFDGLVVSDCGAINDFYVPGRHEVSPNAQAASAKAVLAGTDVECGSVYNKLPQAVKEGLITEAQIDEYYRKHPEKFVLQVPVVRADFLCISPESPSLAEFRRNIVSDDVPQMQITDSLAYSSAIKYENFGGRWIDMTVLAKEFGLDYAELMTFRKGEWIERSGDTGLLSIAYIREFVPAGKLAPIGYATPLIRDILLSTRKRELVSNLEQDLLEQARENGKFEIY